MPADFNPLIILPLLMAAGTVWAISHHLRSGRVGFSRGREVRRADSPERFWLAIALLSAAAVYCVWVAFSSA